MAKLLCVAQWPDDGKFHPDYPIEFGIVAAKGETIDWSGIEMTVSTQYQPDGEKSPILTRKGDILNRELKRLVSDIKSLIEEQRQNHITFAPITPSFELWINRLSDEQYRIILWMDMQSDYDGASNIAYQGVRFMTNRARLMGFIRGLEAETK